MDALWPAHALSTADVAKRFESKVKHAAQEFESVLLQTLLEPLEKSFSTLPGKDDLSGGDNYHYLGTQALTAAMSQSGGIGLARMMVRTLLKASSLSTKDSGSSADGIRR